MDRPVTVVIGVHRRQQKSMATITTEVALGVRNDVQASQEFLLLDYLVDTFH